MVLWNWWHDPTHLRAFHWDDPDFSFEVRRALWKPEVRAAMWESKSMANDGLDDVSWWFQLVRCWHDDLMMANAWWLMMANAWWFNDGIWWLMMITIGQWATNATNQNWSNPRWKLLRDTAADCLRQLLLAGTAGDVNCGGLHISPRTTSVIFDKGSLLSVSNPFSSTLNESE